MEGKCRKVADIPPKPGPEVDPCTSISVFFSIMASRILFVALLLGFLYEVYGLPVGGDPYPGNIPRNSTSHDDEKTDISQSIMAIPECGKVRPKNEVAQIINIMNRPLVVTHNWTISSLPNEQHETDEWDIKRMMKAFQKNGTASKEHRLMIPSPGGIRYASWSAYSTTSYNAALSGTLADFWQKFSADMDPHMRILQLFKDRFFNGSVMAKAVTKEGIMLYVFSQDGNETFVTGITPTGWSYLTVFSASLPEAVKAASVIRTWKANEDSQEGYSLVAISNGLYMDYLVLPVLFHRVGQLKETSLGYLYRKPIPVDQLLGCAPILCLDSSIDAAFNSPPIGHSITIIKGYFRWQVSIEKLQSMSNSTATSMIWTNEEPQRYDFIRMWGASHVDASMTEPNGYQWLFCNNLVWLLYEGIIQRGYPQMIETAIPPLADHLPIDAAFAYYHSRYFFSGKKLIHMSEGMTEVVSVTPIRDVPAYIDAAVYIPPPVDQLVLFKNHFVYLWNSESGNFTAGEPTVSLLSSCNGFDYAAADMTSREDFLQRINSGKSSIIDGPEYESLDSNGTVHKFPHRAESRHQNLLNLNRLWVMISFVFFNLTFLLSFGILLATRLAKPPEPGPVKSKKSDRRPIIIVK